MAASPPPDFHPVDVDVTPCFNRKHKDGYQLDGRMVPFPPKFARKRALYSPHGKWAWTGGCVILSNDPGTRLGSGLEGTVKLKVGTINDKVITYISKLSSVWDSWKMLFSSVYLNATTKYLRPLQGDCIPWVIGVYHCNGGQLGVAQDLPHPNRWREADMFLEDQQKEAIIAAYQKLHDRGILHGDAEYRHMLIGEDGKVTIIDFGFSRVIDPDEQAKMAYVERCSPVAINDEMRKVKFMLDWKDSQAVEYKLARIREAREEKHRAARLADSEAHSFSLANVPEEPMSEEEKAAPGGGLRLCDLNDWSQSGAMWTARRYEVVHDDNRATITKTDIPHPPIPEKAKAEESTPASAVTAVPAPEAVVPAVETVVPALETVVPALETVVPALETVAPALETVVPALETVVPALETVVPTLETAKTPEVSDDANGPLLRRHGVRKPGTLQQGPLAMTGMNNAVVREAALGAKRSRKREESDDSTVGSGTTGESGEPAKKRQRSSGPSTSSGPKLKREIYEPTSAIHCHGYPTNTDTSTPSGSSAANVSPTQRAPAPSKATRGIPRDLTADPTSYDLDPEAGPALRAEAWQNWTNFLVAAAHIEQLQSDIDEERPKVERYRADFIRIFLMLPPEQRTAFWKELGQPDVHHLLGFSPGSLPSSKPARVLETARTQLSKIRTPPPPKPGMRDVTPRLKIHPRLAAIKRAEARARPPSKLSQAIDVAYASSPDCSSPSSRPSPCDKPELQAKFDKYQEVVLKRAQVEEARDRALMPPPRQSPSSKDPPTPTGSFARKVSVDVDTEPTPASSAFAPNTSSDVLPPEVQDTVLLWRQRVAEPAALDGLDKPVAPAKRPVLPRPTTRCAGPAVLISRVTSKPAVDTAATVPGCGSPPASSDTATSDAGPSTRSITKRKREEADGDGASPGSEPGAKKAKATCGFM